MAHSVSEAAARAVKNSQRVKAEERTPEQILKGIRGNLAAKLAVTPSDTAFLLAQYEAAEAAVIHLGGATAGLLSRAEFAEAEYAASVQIITARNHEVIELQAQVDRFREVYELENRNSTLFVAPEAVAQLEEEFAAPVASPQTYGEKLDATHFVAHAEGDEV